LNVNPHLHRLHVLYLSGTTNIFTLAHDATADTAAAAMWIVHLGTNTLERLRAELLAMHTPRLEQAHARSSIATAASSRHNAEKQAYATHNARPHAPFKASRMFHSSLLGVMLITLAVVLAAGVVTALALDLPRETIAEVLMLVLAALSSGCAGDWAGRTRRPLAAALALALVPLSAAALFVVGAAGPSPVTAGLIGALVTAFACGSGVLIGNGRVEAPKIRATERDLVGDLAAVEAGEHASLAGDAAAWATESAQADWQNYRELVVARTLEAFDLFVAKRTAAGIDFPEAAALREQVSVAVAEWPTHLGLPEPRAAA
jgi:hypothetical protein